MSSGEGIMRLSEFQRLFNESVRVEGHTIVVAYFIDDSKEQERARQAFEFYVGRGLQPFISSPRGRWRYITRFSEAYGVLEKTIRFMP